MYTDNLKMRMVAAAVACLAVMTVFSGCEKDDEPDSPKEVEVTNVTINPPAPGVELTAGGGTITLSVTIEPANATDKTVTWSSSNNAIATVSAAGVVTGHTEGDVIITATTKSGNRKADFPVTVKPDPKAVPVELKSPITVNTTLKDLGLTVDYVFTGNGVLNVENNATLTIEPGVTIQFTQKNGYIDIRQGSTIKAEGTASKPVQFIGASDSKGSWRGVVISSNNTVNVLNYVEILNAGSQNSDYSAALFLYNGKADLNHCTIDRSSSNGITIRGASGNHAGELGALANCTISNCDKAPIYTYENATCYALRNIANNNTFTGNTNAYIHIRQMDNPRILDDMTLKALNGYPWYFERGLFIDADRNVTIEPGAVVLMGGGQRIYISSTSHLIAVGTPTARITIKGFKDETGYWNGISVSSQTPGTKFDYCDISNGGYPTEGIVANNGLIMYSGTRYVEIYNSHLSKSLNSGVVCGHSSATVNAHSNAFLKHANVTFSQITGAVFRISAPTQGNYNALPAMNGNNWWQHF